MQVTTVKWITVPTTNGTQQILVDDVFDPRILDGYVFEIRPKKGLSVYSLHNQYRARKSVPGSINEIFGRPSRSKRTNNIDVFDYTSGAWSKKGTPRYIDCYFTEIDTPIINTDSTSVKRDGFFAKLFKRFGL